jgi:hypothetical protein
MKEQTTNAYIARRSLWYMIGVIFFTIMSVSGFPILENSVSASEADPTKLVGRWMRTDGGYELELSNPTFEGRLTAAYFNPHPINVFYAGWKLEGGYVYMLVELRDKGYPGSTYMLSYDPETDRLEGIYYHAALKQEFEVVFQRKE